MNNKIKSIFKKELREMFRDKKSLSMMLLIPIMIPLMVLGMSALFNAQMNTPVSEYNRIGFNYEMSSAEKELASTDHPNISLLAADIFYVSQKPG